MIHLLEIILLSDFSSPLFYPSLLGFTLLNYLHLLHGLGLGIESIFCSALASSSLESLNQLILEADRESLPHVYLARGSYSIYSQIYLLILNKKLQKLTQLAIRCQLSARRVEKVK
jgi:hypothetical protein